MKHSDLIARLEAADVGSRELDVPLYKIENPNMRPVRSLVGTFFDPHKTSEQTAEKFHVSGGATAIAPRYTTSLDAALALAERVLPGWKVCMATGRDKGDFANVFPGDPNVDLVYYDAHAQTLPLALCVAILKALEAKQ